MTAETTVSSMISFKKALEKAVAEDPEAPIFVIAHHGVYNSAYTTNEWYGNYGENPYDMVALMAQYPQVIFTFQGTLTRRWKTRGPSTRVKGSPAYRMVRWGLTLKMNRKDYFQRATFDLSRKNTDASQALMIDGTMTTKSQSKEIELDNRRIYL